MAPHRVSGAPIVVSSPRAKSSQRPLPMGAPALAWLYCAALASTESR